MSEFMIGPVSIQDNTSTSHKCVEHIQAQPLYKHCMCVQITQQC